LFGCGTSGDGPRQGPDAASAVSDAGAAGHVTQDLVVAIDVSSDVGAVRDLLGVNKKPRAPDARENGTTYNLPAAYKAFGISQVRLHDDVIDLCTIYTDAKIEDFNTGAPVITTNCKASTAAGSPHLKWTVRDASKVDDPSNYRFADLDAALALIAASGAKAYVRLGHNYNGVNDVGDTASWAKVATNIFKHIIGSFAEGATKVDPSYVEVFNEPDGMFWVGSKTDFFALFNGTVDGVRAAAAAAGKSVLIGGPGFTANYLTTVKKATSSANGFVDGVTPGRLDFFSVHSYDTCETATLKNGETSLKNVRDAINAQGLTAKPMHITEWNIGLDKKCTDDLYASAQAQSFVSGMLTIMQDSQYNITEAHFYAGVPNMSLFALDKASPGLVTVRPSAWSLWAHSKLSGGTRYATQVCTGGKCESATAASSSVVALAGVAAGKRYAVVTNDTDAASTFTVRTNGGATAGTFRAHTPPRVDAKVTATKSGAEYTLEEGPLTALIASVPAVELEGVSTAGGLEVNLTLQARAIVLVELP
jgi:hypothetical protein